jgi:signal transduction histidine kinase
MRTKLFFAFILIILLALFSNIVFEKLIIDDFNDFIEGTEEDHIYWVLASIEGSYREGNWDVNLLKEALHWGMMLGFETYLEDENGKKVLSSKEVISSMNPNMLARMRSFLKLPEGKGEFTWYPLFIKGNEVGRLYIRKLERLGLTPQKEEIFRRRGKEFLFISFIIAGGGALCLAILLTVFISNPIRRLTVAAERIAKGDFTASGPKPGRFRFLKGRDEIDMLTENFNYMAEALRREEELRKHLTSNVAHELRTPLTVIMGNLEAIEDGVISDPHAVIKNIKEEIKRLIYLVEGIEDVTRAEASFFKKGEKREINLSDFIESIVKGMKDMIEEKGLSITTRGPSLWVRSYPEKLHIIIKNLLSNAYKFTDRGEISVEWGTYRREGTNEYYITVRDTGRGIPQGEHDRIFMRFYKSDDSRGRGLGLAIVRELAEVIDATIKVDSTPEKGSSFTLIFK